MASRAHKKKQKKRQAQRSNKNSDLSSSSQKKEQVEKPAYVPIPLPEHVIQKQTTRVEDFLADKEAQEKLEERQAQEAQEAAKKRFKPILEVEQFEQNNEARKQVWDMTQGLDAEKRLAYLNDFLQREPVEQMKNCLFGICTILLNVPFIQKPEQKVTADELPPPIGENKLQAYCTYYRCDTGKPRSEQDKAIEDYVRDKIVLDPHRYFTHLTRVAEALEQYNDKKNNQLYEHIHKLYQEHCQDSTKSLATKASLLSMHIDTSRSTLKEASPFYMWDVLETQRGIKRYLEKIGISMLSRAKRPNTTE